MKINLGSGKDIKIGWKNVDVGFTDEDLKQDGTIKSDAFVFISGLESNTVTDVKAHHVLEHIENLDAFMVELHRVCKPSAKVDIVVPLANTLWDVANPDHKRRFNHRTFQYYTVDFVTSDLGLFRGYRIVSQNIEREDNEWFGGIEWIVANLHSILEVVK